MRASAGMTVVELLVVLAVVGIFVGAASMYFNPSQGSLQDGMALFEGFVAQSRARAMATTSARRVRPTTSAKLVSESAASCAATTWTTDSRLDLPSTVQLTSTAWTVCFGDRGTSTVNLTVGFQQAALTRSVEIMLGGTTRVVP